jgi:L-2,4-diaminobutyrate decarboxylase
MTVDLLAHHVDQSQRGIGPVLRRTPPAELTERLRLREHLRDGGMTLADYTSFLDTYLAEGTHLHHPGYLAHHCASPDIPAALADLVHGVTNNVPQLYEMGASAAVVEFEVVRWMLDKVGFTAGNGVLTQGGSLANLTALLAARAAVAPDAWAAGTPGDLTLLAPPSAHYSLARSAGILGLGTNRVHPLPVDPLGRIDVPRLPEVLDLPGRPIALVANAGATSTGLYDDLAGIGDFCRAHGIWLHVDGAFGLSALLSHTHRHLCDGIESADSVMWDTHKLLRTSGTAAAVLTRQNGALEAAFTQDGAYLFYGEQQPDQIGSTVEVTKAELGLKMFLNLAWRGENGLGEYVAQTYDTAHRLWQLADARPGFHCPFEPESDVTCFRFGDGDQNAIRLRLMDEGSFHLSSTEIDGTRYLRVTVVAPMTDEHTMHTLLDRITDLNA